MGAALVMAMFAGPELGPMSTPVTAKDLVGTWKTVECTNERGQATRTTTTFYSADGKMQAVTRFGQGPELRYEGTYTVEKGRIRKMLRGPTGIVNDNTGFIWWVRGGKLCTSLNGGDYCLHIRINNL